MTTISQALVKGLYFEHFRPGPAKIRQTLLAFLVLDPLIPKDDQLRLFVNTCWLGSRDGEEVRGFAQAAQVYYGRPFAELDEAEYISLVAMIIAPQTFNVHHHLERNAERVARIQALISGRYQLKGLFDLYYGEVPEDVRGELPPLSYFEGLYK